jgi:hypothetical protein
LGLGDDYHLQQLCDW